MGSFLTRAVHVHEWISPPSPYLLLDFNLDHWRFSWRDLGVWDLAKVLLGRSPIGHSTDNAAYDCTVAAMAQHNAVLKTYQGTYYRSYVTSCVSGSAAPGGGLAIASLTWPRQCLPLLRCVAPQTREDPQTGRHVPSATMPMLLRPLASMVGAYVPAKPAHLAADFCSSEWWENDGIVSVVSQQHPFACGYAHAGQRGGPGPGWGGRVAGYRGGSWPARCPSPPPPGCQAPRQAPCRHFGVPSHGRGATRPQAVGDAAVVDDEDVSLVEIEAGVWQVLRLEDCSHVGLVPFPQSRQQQSEVMASFVQYLHAVEERMYSVVPGP